MAYIITIFRNKKPRGGETPARQVFATADSIAVFFALRGLLPLRIQSEFGAPNLDCRLGNSLPIRSSLGRAGGQSCLTPFPASAAKGFYLSSAELTRCVRKSEKKTPTAASDFGRRDSSVIPGNVFVSR